MATKKKIKKKKRTTLKRRQKQLKIQRIKIFSIISIIAILILLFYMAVYVNTHDGDDKIANGVFVCKVDVSGLSQKQAVKKLDKHFSKLENTNFTFKVDNNEIDIPLSKFGLEYKDTTVKELAKEAFDYGKKGLIISRFFKVKNAKNNKAAIDAEFDIRKDSANIALRESLPKFDGAAKNATIKIKNGKPHVASDKDGLVIDKEKTIKSILNILNDNWDEKPHVVKVSNKIGKADIRKKDIKNIKDELGSYTTTYDTTATSASNIETGTAHINGLIVFPGEEISINAIMEPYTEEEGYTMSDSYESGKVVQTMGGGICQVSTTLYNALIYSELEITMRFPHSMPIKYVPYGMDAAIADDVKDLHFRNNLDYPIYIYGSCEEGTCTFAIYGKEYRDSNREISFESIVDSEEELNTGKYITTTDAEGNQVKKLNKDHSLNVITYKIVYENDLEVSREEFCRSSYLIRAYGDED